MLSPNESSHGMHTSDLETSVFKQASYYEVIIDHNIYRTLLRYYCLKGIFIFSTQLDDKEGVALTFF